MSTKAQVQCELIGDTSGNSPAPLETWPEASGQSFPIGALIYLASGAVTEVGDAGTVIWGIAKQAASATTGTVLKIQPLTLTSLIAFCVYTASTATAITAATVPGTKVTLARPTAHSNYYAAPSNLSSNAGLVVRQIDTRDVVGDVYGRYDCTILYSCLQTIIGA